MKEEEIPKVDISGLHPKFVDVALSYWTNYGEGDFSTEWTKVISVHNGEEICWELSWEKVKTSTATLREINDGAWKVTMSSPGQSSHWFFLETPFVQHERYSRFEMSKLAREIVRNTAPYLTCEGGNDLKRIGASEYKKDEARLGEHSKKFLDAAQLAARRACKARNLLLGKLSTLELDAAFLVKLVARRTIIEDVLADYNAGRELKSPKEYIKAAMPEVEKAIVFLIGKMEDNIPQFRVRVFPESAPGKPVKVKGKLGTYLVDKYTGVVTSSSKKETWSVQVDHPEWIVQGGIYWTVEETKGDVTQEKLDDILSVLQENFPKGIRYIKTW